MINNIPIGINACIVKIDLVLRDMAYLWRPTSDLHVMADAMNREIQWPLTKMKRISQNAEVPSVRNSPGNGSSNSGSSNGKNKKCFLLDCKNPGKTVAEGRVCSTDPADKVHNRPLGPNATKVWVVVSLIDNAKVWRPSSEVQIIADAQGTTVAWPNDKIVYL
ncbi:uncharacterized protein LOC110227332 [Arabidopsis lyrata subsp. lyrata]|uniref:uncharacterized protein LOC110227332 n=2 Tax=Arabidopsis lyrata subsp. lyrata TaxID=81972 RepID=UPI000A29DEE8|nr:uncharacterized protein LOC110227332 [Arabidopsis lyrata subsp. lyrata]|eukprot:XP_020876981.1 uncharacterized protein LOC110227332 [Arabidopsis lyrata subsp. lyrata]